MPPGPDELPADSVAAVGVAAAARAKVAAARVKALELGVRLAFALVLFFVALCVGGFIAWYTGRVLAPLYIAKGGEVTGVGTEWMVGRRIYFALRPNSTFERGNRVLHVLENSIGKVASGPNEYAEYQLKYANGTIHNNVPADVLQVLPEHGTGVVKAWFEEGMRVLYISNNNNATVESGPNSDGDYKLKFIYFL